MYANRNKQVTVREMTIVIDDWEYHRNGVSGAPFYVVRFRWDEPGQHPEEPTKERRFIATVGTDDFEVDEHDRIVGPKRGINPSCRVIAEDMLGVAEDGRLEHSLVLNRWRGDHFYEAIVKGIVELVEEQERENEYV